MGYETSSRNMVPPKKVTFEPLAEPNLSATLQVFLQFGERIP